MAAEDPDPNALNKCLRCGVDDRVGFPTIDATEVGHVPRLSETLDPEPRPIIRDVR